MSVHTRPSFFDDLKSISRRASRSEADIALELMTILKGYLPPGEIDSSSGRRSLGWIILTHLCSDIRALLLGQHTLWSDVVSAFPRTDVISALLSRAHSYPVTVNFDSLCSSPNLDHTVQCLNTFVDLDAGRPHALLLDADVISYSSALESPYTTVARTLLLSIPRIFNGGKFSNLVDLTLHIVGRVAPFQAPVLQDLTLIGTRMQDAGDDQPESISFGWKQSPVLTLENFQHITRGSPSLNTLELRGLRLQGEATGIPFTRRSLRHIKYELRQPDSIQKAFACIRGVASTRTYALARLNYSSPLPDWVWQVSDLTRVGPLALVVESCRSMVWLTMMTMDDAATSSRPVYCDQHDTFKISVPRKDRPTIFVRTGRISRLYIPETEPLYLSALTRDIQLIAPRVQAFYALEMAINIGGHDVWLRPSKVLVEHVFRPLTNMSYLVIEDERLAHLPLYKPATCARVDYVCRGDWYGKSGISFFSQAIVKKNATLSAVHIRGVSRVCDDEFCNTLRNIPRFSQKVHVERDTPVELPARSDLSVQLDDARALVHYREMKILAIQAEIDIESGGLI